VGGRLKKVVDARAKPGHDGERTAVATEAPLTIRPHPVSLRCTRQGRPLYRAAHSAPPWSRDLRPTHRRSPEASPSSGTLAN